MIRFCDKEVICVNKDTLSRAELVVYFLDNHREEKIYVIDALGKYIGYITYESLLGNDLEAAICKECLILDETIWEQGRRYLSEGKSELPVVNKDRQMVCFAWQDYEANRELRMLDELLDCQRAADFREIFPEYDCVVIYGCNELAYYLADYLKKCNLTVCLEGDLWKEFLIWTEDGEYRREDFLDYKVYAVYSEGVLPTEERVAWKESVSAEFECIDLIYEENIRRGHIRDIEMDFLNMVDRLVGKQIGILGTSQEALDAYDLLLGYGVDIYCFVESGKDNLFGIQVINGVKARENEEIIFVDPCARYSAWGFGGTDLYHYFGYKRNKQFLLLQDYIEIPRNGLCNVLSRVQRQSGSRLVLVGDPWLSWKLGQILKSLDENALEKIVCCDILGRGSCNEDKKRFTQISVEEVSEKDNCLIILPEQYACYDFERQQSYYNILCKEIREKLEQFVPAMVETYFTENSALIKYEQNIFGKSDINQYKVGTIIIGAHENGNGNFFFRSLLDHHPDVLMLDDGYLSENLFSICIRLSTKKGLDILTLFWKLCYSEAVDWRRGWVQVEILKFNMCMEKMLSEKDTFTSQELFVMIHIAFARMLGKEIKDLSKMVIYWEPHGVPRDTSEEYSDWLHQVADSRFIINMIRNYCTRTGTLIKYDWTFFKEEGIQKNKNRMYFDIIGIESFVYKQKKKYDGWKRIEIKFEDLKCNPKQELLNLCRILGLMWSDTLLETTFHGKQAYYGDVTGFDLRPVYGINHKHFSTFDIFKISMLARPWQKRYKYPFVDSLDFSRRELMEMYRKEFCFEEAFCYKDQEEKKDLQAWKSKWFSNSLWMARRMEVMEKIDNANDGG